MRLLKLYIDQEVADSPEVISIKSRLNLPSETVHDARELFEGQVTFAYKIHGMQNTV
ncbi:MAG TPA: hypothetical protein VMW78_05380 [Anaerolineae bacterium]|nr:hypothetical protein [Anaerolineae bacterium]